MDQFRMKCFISVAKNRSISRAAREMFISQPAMTAQMNALEKELDARLLNRGRVTTLTATGEYVLSRFLTVIAELEDIERQVKTMENETWGKVRLGFHGPFKWAHIDRLLEAFHAEYPSIELNVTVDVWNSLCYAVQRNELDVAFVELREVEDMHDLVQRRLFDEELAVVVSRGHRLSTRQSVRIDDIRDEPLHEPDYRISPKFLNYFHKRITAAGLDIKTVGQGNHWEATLALVASNMGITIMPRSFATGVADVVFIDLEDADVTLNMGLVWHRGTDDRALMRFVNYCSTWSWMKTLSDT